MSDQQVLCEVLGFKYCSTINATPFSLQKVTALMLQHGVIQLDDILPWLVPDDKTIMLDHEQAMKQAKEYVRKLSVISTKDKEDVVEEKDNAQVTKQKHFIDLLIIKQYLIMIYRHKLLVIIN